MNGFYEFQFYLFSLLAIASALLFVTRTNPVPAALWLVNVMFALAPFIKETFLARALHSGADIEGQIPANTAKWTERKRKLGLSTNKMKASGQLASWLKDSRFRVVRVK